MLFLWNNQALILSISCSPFSISYKLFLPYACGIIILNTHDLISRNSISRPWFNVSNLFRHFESLNVLKSFNHFESFNVSNSSMLTHSMFQICHCWLTCLSCVCQNRVFGCCTCCARGLTWSCRLQAFPWKIINHWSNGGGFYII